jgi:hypothetical protein
VELKINRSRLLIGLTSVAAAFAVVGIVVAPGSKSETVDPASADSPGTCVDLARKVDPGKVRVDSAYDPERDLVLAEYEGSTYAMRPNDPMCRALEPSRAVIDGMMSAHRENMAVACKAMRGIVARKDKEFRGRRVNQEAARRFISRRCGSGES